MDNFTVYKFYAYSGPNYYINRQAMVFNLYIKPDCPDVYFFREQIIAKYPELEKDYPDSIAELFAKVLVMVFKLDMNLFIRQYAISQDEDEWVIAIEHIDDFFAENAIQFVSEWFFNMTEPNYAFNFNTGFARLQSIFNQTILGSPTLYALVEGSIKRKINIHYLPEENVLQWGYGKKQVRGLSTIFHCDSAKDIELANSREKISEWLDIFGFPNAKSIICQNEEEIVEEAALLGFPVVIKPIPDFRGEGVKTGITTEDKVRLAYRNIRNISLALNMPFAGAIVQQQINGCDYRILMVGGKFVACLKRIPAYVLGDGGSTILQLIEAENSKPIREDNIRSPLVKIRIDDDLLDILRFRGLGLDSIPALGEEVILSRVANISGGGISVNVTQEIHKANIQLAQDISKFYNITCLGIDLLAADISKPWSDGDFAVIGIKSGPGIFMHLSPAEGGSVDVPGTILEHFFTKKIGHDRIPIIAGNNLDDEFFSKLYKELKRIDSEIEMGSVQKSGVYFNDKFFRKADRHDLNCMVVLRKPKLDIAVFNHSNDNINDYGVWHQGIDVSIMEHPKDAELLLSRDLLEDGYLIKITNHQGNETTISLWINDKQLDKKIITNPSEKTKTIIEILKPYLIDIVFKYEV